MFLLDRLQSAMAVKDKVCRLKEMFVLIMEDPLFAETRLWGGTGLTKQQLSSIGALFQRFLVIDVLFASVKVGALTPIYRNRWLRIFT